MELSEIHHFAKIKTLNLLLDVISVISAAGIPPEHLGKIFQAGSILCFYSCHCSFRKRFRNDVHSENGPCHGDIYDIHIVHKLQEGLLAVTVCKEGCLAGFGQTHIINSLGNAFERSVTKLWNAPIIT